jgi:hypothetical protein
LLVSPAAMADVPASSEAMIKRVTGRFICISLTGSVSIRCGASIGRAA